MDTAPKDRENTRIEDAAGAVELGHGSPETGRSVAKDGSPTCSSPSQWYLETGAVDPEEATSGRSLVAAVVLVPLIFIGVALLGALDPFKAQTSLEMMRVDGGSAAGLDQRPDVETGSPAFLQSETSGISMPVVAASTAEAPQRLDADAPRNGA